MSALHRHLVALPRPAKHIVLVLNDAVLCTASVIAAVYLRTDRVPEATSSLLITIALVISISIPVFAASGLYRTMIRHVDWSAMSLIIRAVLLASIPVVATVTFAGLAGVPRTVGILQPILLLLFVSVSRILARIALGDLFVANNDRKSATPVVIYGAGSAGRQLASALSRGSGIQVLAFVDDDPTLQKRILNSIPIFHPDRIEELARDGQITEVLLALPSATRQRRNDIISYLRRHPVRVQTLPSLADLASGRVSLSDLRELEIEDLLGREPVVPNAILMGKNTAGKIVLVTGAGGSIGSELCRQILSTRPSTLLLVDVNEFVLYTVHEELRNYVSFMELNTEIIPLLASTTDYNRFDQIISTWRPNTIYHAAAYKHVPLVEHNVISGVYNNVWGTLIAAQTAIKHGVADFVLISTDKAVRPTNIMGTTKRLAEMILQALATEDSSTRFSMVRFGNVLGSSGSVVPLFRRQIANGGPVTITHKEITRYFMTIPEAAQLVIQAGAMASSGEVFVLDMGEPVRIYDLARNMIELSGYTVRDDDCPNGEIEIEVIGLRPAEKLYEELLISDNPLPTRHPRIFKATEKMLPWSVLEGSLKDLSKHLELGHADQVRSRLHALVPEYCPDEEIVDWVFTEKKLDRLRSAAGANLA